MRPLAVAADGRDKGGGGFPGVKPAQTARVGYLKRLTLNGKGNGLCKH